MTLTPSMLTDGEERIFMRLLNLRGDRTFNGVLCRDGVPEPEIYLKQRIRVLFVFKEPNSKGKPREWDMRAQVRDPEYRGFPDGKPRKPGFIHPWWDRKAGSLAHAVVHALSGADVAESLADFQNRINCGQRSQDILSRFAFIQVKKVGGAGRADPLVIEHHARTYRAYLKGKSNCTTRT